MRSGSLEQGTQAYLIRLRAWQKLKSCAVITSRPLLWRREEVKYCDKGWRGWGVQGIPSVEMVQKVTKMSVRIWSPRQVARYLDEAYKVAFADRPGPVWLDLPRDIQSQNVPNDT